MNIFSIFIVERYMKFVAIGGRWFFFLVSYFFQKTTQKLMSFLRNLCTLCVISCTIVDINSKVWKKTSAFHSFNPLSNQQMSRNTRFWGSFFASKITVANSWKISLYVSRFSLWKNKIISKKNHNLCRWNLYPTGICSIGLWERVVFGLWRKGFCKRFVQSDARLFEHRKVKCVLTLTSKTFFVSLLSTF